METDVGTTGPPEEVRCAECNSLIHPGQEKIEAGDKVFCRLCFEKLNAQLEEAIRQQGTDIDYLKALVGGALGGALGVLVWWGFTVLTKIAFGLVAVVIGWAVGKGITLLTGEKRSQGLQTLSVVVAAISFVYASYLVNRTFILQALADQGEEAVLPLLPDPELLYRVVSADFGIFDLVFLAIVLYEAWRLPAPIKLADGGAGG